MTDAVLNIKGMTCDHCVKSVRKALVELDGVDSAEVDLKNQKAAVRYDESRISIDRLRETVRKIGYEAE